MQTVVGKPNLTTLMKKVAFLTTVFLCSAVLSLGQTNLVNTECLNLNSNLSGIFLSDTTKYIVVHATLTNTSSDTIYYAFMKCAWTSSYVVNSRAFEIDTAYCMNDKVEVEMLPPQNRIDYYLIAGFKKSFRKLKKKKYKIGFNAVMVNNHESFADLIIKIKGMKSIIWSNSFDLKITESNP